MNDIRIDLTRGGTSSQPVPAGSLLAGRAFIDWYLTEHVSPRIHPLSEDNVLIVSPGLFGGTSAPSSGRLSVGGKSPLTGGVKEANAGGPAGHKLGRLGVRSIVVHGKAADWQVLKIDAKGPSLEPAGDLVGLRNYEAAERLRDRFGADVTTMTVGPAGERLYSTASIACSDMEGRPARHAARGGLGALMGSKRLKAIVIDDSGTTWRRATDPELFKRAVKDLSQELRDYPLVDIVHQLGTAFFVGWEHDNGALVTHNHRSGSFHAIKGIDADAAGEWEKEHGGARGHRCMPGCAVACSNVVHDRDGRYLTASLEFETISLCGSNLGLERWEDVAKVDRFCDDFGLDTIDTGAAIGVLNDVGLYEFGDFERVEALMEEIAQGTPLGRILGNGVAMTAKAFGISRVPAVKNQAIPAHAARASKGWAVTYATSPQGADHTAGAVSEDRLNPAHQVDRSRWAQVIQCALDTTGLCHFTFLDRTERQLEIIASAVGALHGIDFSRDDFVALGKQVLLQERDFNRRAGLSEGADGLPEWMRTEPLSPHNVVFDVPQDDLDEFFDLSKATGFVVAQDFHQVWEE
ncbi:MAG: aldehyde ferredoxin oxidoreductase [Thermoleophilia bacterium]|nr:aldehyde ferredoxin oxidoreductase [Thermoleophilia bacterium]